MSSDSVSLGHRPAGWQAIEEVLLADGSATHPHVATLLAARAAQRDLADAVHAICSVHGGAAERIHDSLVLIGDDAARGWLERVAEGFSIERSYLAQIVSAAGPLPSTPGQAQTEQAFAATRHAFQTLALSARHGCMLGAACAQVVDWQTLRAVLDHAAERFGVELQDGQLPDRDETRRMGEHSVASRGTERAMAFGAQQALAQHRALFDLLEARSSARGD